MRLNLMEAISARGVIVTRAISIYRANKKLTIEDLGLEDVPKGVRLGHLKLLEECSILDELRQIESDVGGEITKKTFDFCGLARFATREKMEELRTFIESKQDEFLAKKEEFFVAYPDLIEQGVNEWRNKAAVLQVDADKLARAVRDAFPSLHDLRKKFKFHFAFMPLADMEGVNRANELQSMCDTFIEDAAIKVRVAAQKTIEQITETFEQGKYTNRTINTVQRLMERVKEMALVPDADLEKRIAEFNEEFGTLDAKDLKADADVEKRMMNGVKKLGADIKKLAEADVLEEMRSKFCAGVGRSIE